MRAEELAEKMKAGKPPAIVDVRTGFEFNRGHIPGALHCPTWMILLGLAPLPKEKDEEVVVTCEHGPRAQIVKGILGFLGYRNVTLLEGHMYAWRKAGCPQKK